MRRNPSFQRKTVLLTVMAVALMAFSFTSAGAQEPSGTVIIDEYQLAYIFNGNVGGGKLYFQGNVYDFKIGGVGIGGIGASHITATGEVYNLTDLSQFPGAYVQGSMGITITDKGKGHLWLQNKNGVVLSLKTSQEGLGLTAGADGILVKME